MKNRLVFLFKYFVFWIFVLELFRLFFLLYNIDYVSGVPIPEVLKSFLYGVKLDLSLTGYVLLLVSFVSALLFFHSKLFYLFTDALTFLLLLVFSFIVAVDMELYGHWGFRIDSTVLLYIKTPEESLASTPTGKILWLVLAVILSTVIFYGIYKKAVRGNFKKEFLKWYQAPLFLILAAFMILPIRGGTGLAPINQGSVFFSQHQFANHVAVNPVWNFGSSVLHSGKRQTVSFMTHEKAGSIVADLLKPDKVKPAVKLIDGNQKPNILIIILESFTANVIEPLGGVKGATPQFNRLTGEGVFFSNFYASGDRSDKGIVALLSGYPAQPVTSIIKYVRKTERLPFLSRNLQSLGYSAAFYYGGDIDFANMKSYFINGGFTKLVTLEDFDKKDLNSKWGAHDHVVFNRLLDDLNSQKEPFFNVMFTLSSHEPYDVPHHSRFNGFSEKEMFLNSVHYTDSCVGDFIRRAQNTGWWKNTWVILVADHGKMMPADIPYYDPRKFRIPMLWLGGAVIKDTVIGATASQVDLPLMIRNQLDENWAGYAFSKDVLNGGKHFAFYAYNNGFGFYNDTTGYVWDNNAQKIILNPEVPKPVEEQGKAFFQWLIDDFNAR